MDGLVAAAIHDAKNSLATLMGSLTQAQRDITAGETGQAHATLARATAVTARLSGQLVELLVLFRAGEGSLRLTVEDHYLEDFLTDLLDELGPPAASETTGSPLRFVPDFSAVASIPNWAFDAYLVKFALLDALRNARRHARQEVRLALGQDPEGGLRFRVEDDGEGYPESVLHGEPAAGMSAESSGLGLSFARLIAELHVTPSGRHGHLELTNQGGACFTMVLP